MAYSAIKLLNTNLLSSYQNANNLEAKQRCLLAPAFALPAALNSGFGLITACRHQLGARFNIAHGLASAIMMPPVLKWNFDFSIHQFSDLANVLNLAKPSDDAEIAAEIFLRHVTELTIKLNLNKKLSDFIENKKHLQDIVKPIMESTFIQTNIRPVTSEKELADLLNMAW